MMFADAANASSFLGAWISAAALVIALGGGVFTLFITRREVESHKSASDQRLSAHEATHKDLFAKLGGVERGAGDKVEKARAEFRHDLAELHEKINRVDKNTTAIEVETRMQSRTITAIATKLNVSA